MSNNPVKFVNPDGRTNVYFDEKGNEIHRVESDEPDRVFYNSVRDGDSYTGEMLVDRNGNPVGENQLMKYIMEFYELGKGDEEWSIDSNPISAWRSVSDNAYKELPSTGLSQSNDYIGLGIDTAINTFISVYATKKFGGKAGLAVAAGYTAYSGMIGIQTGRSFGQLFWDAINIYFRPPKTRQDADVQALMTMRMQWSVR